MVPKNIKYVLAFESECENGILEVSTDLDKTDTEQDLIDQKLEDVQELQVAADDAEEKVKNSPDEITEFDVSMARENFERIATKLGMEDSTYLVYDVSEESMGNMARRLGRFAHNVKELIKKVLRWIMEKLKEFGRFLQDQGRKIYKLIPILKRWGVDSAVRMEDFLKEHQGAGEKKMTLKNSELGGLNDICPTMLIGVTNFKTRLQGILEGKPFYMVAVKNTKAMSDLLISQLILIDNIAKDNETKIFQSFLKDFVNELKDLDDNIARELSDEDSYKYTYTYLEKNIKLKGVSRIIPISASHKDIRYVTLSDPKDAGSDLLGSGVYPTVGAMSDKLDIEEITMEEILMYTKASNIQFKNIEMLLNTADTAIANVVEKYRQTIDLLDYINGTSDEDKANMLKDYIQFINTVIRPIVFKIMPRITSDALHFNYNINKMLGYIFDVMAKKYSLESNVATEDLKSSTFKFLRNIGAY